MRKISLEEKAKIILLGGFISLILTLFCWALFARIIHDLYIDMISGNEILGLIYIGLEIITLISSIVIAIFITEDTKKKTIYKASFLSFFITFTIILFLSYIILYIKYPFIYSELEGPEIIFAFPSILFYFSNYILKHEFGIFLLTIIIYFIFYIIFLEKFYEYESNRKEYRKLEDLINKRRR